MTLNWMVKRINMAASGSLANLLCDAGKNKIKLPQILTRTMKEKMKKKMLVTGATSGIGA